MAIPIVKAGREILGLTPALDRRQVGDIHVIEGRNFAFDADGPYSAFGSILLTLDSLPEVELDSVQSFRLSDTSYGTVLLTTKAIYKYDESTQNLFPIYVFSTTPTSDSRWYMAVVGGKNYFVREGFGVLEYTEATNSWFEVTNNVPTGVMAACESDGRLILLGTNEVRRSDIGDGRSLADSSSTGAGAQFLSMVGGSPLALIPVIDGYFVFTTKGILKGEQINERIPFRHDVIADHQMTVISGFSVTELQENDWVWLSKNGFMRSNGRQIEPFEPIMGEYFKRAILPEFDLSIKTTILMEYSEDLETLFVSVSEKEQPYRYTIAYVLYLPVKKWGTFNKLHYGWVELALTTGSNRGNNFGYLCAGGYFHKLINYPYVQLAPPAVSTVAEYEFIHTSLDPPTFIVNGVYHVSSGLNFQSVNPGLFTQPGYWSERVNDEYISEDNVESDLALATLVMGEDWNNGPAPDEDWNALSGTEDYMDNFSENIAGAEIVFRASMADYAISTMPSEYGSVDSSITIGPLRVATEENISQMWGFDSVSLGMLADPSLETVEDFMDFAENLVVDWATVANGFASLTDITEDWGDGEASSTDYDLTITGTLDAYTAYGANTETPFNYLTTTELGANQYTKHFTAETIGIWQLLKIDALNSGQNFHLKLLEVEGNLRGKAR